MKTVQVHEEQLSRILDALFMLGLQDNYIDYDFAQKVRDEVTNLLTEVRSK